jgi:hypothetical protein
MSKPDQPNPSAAGFILAFAILAGAVIGKIAPHPTARGVAVLYWLRDRRRTGR